MPPASPHHALRQALCVVYLEEREPQHRRLRRAFPEDPPEALEDALSEALVALLASLDTPAPSAARVWRDGGCGALGRLLYTVAWRNLRGQHRSSRARHEQPRAELPERPGGPDPHAALAAQRASDALVVLLPEAARRFAPRGAEALESALADRLVSGDSDIRVAERHSIDRSALCRARGWLEDRLAS